jgi:60 kDa SS-A/Ro ribonucleoprotein
MVNKSMFKTESKVAKKLTVNEAGGKAYDLNSENALCQLVVTNCFNDVYYASAEDLLNKVKEVTEKVSSELLAKAAVYGHETARMKDMPAYLLAVLAARGELNLVKKVFPRVITNSKMLCNFVQIIRSGVTGRKSFGSSIKRLIQNWLNSRTPDRLFDDAVGHANPSLADIVKMVHPKGATEAHNAMFAYLIGKDYNWETIPNRVKAYEAFKKSCEGNVPEVDFRLLSNLKLSSEQWGDVAKNMRWDTLRRNLNTLGRNSVFDNKEVVDILAKKLGSVEDVKRSKAFPYELLTTYLYADGIPTKLQNALHDALEASVDNIPDFNIKTVVCVDTSGSMQSPVTGSRGTATSKATCVQIAALIAASVLRKNSEHTLVLPFDTSVHSVKIDGRDSIMTNSQKLSLRGGGTDCSSALRHLNHTQHEADLVIYVSDNESWMGYSRSNSTPMRLQWLEYKRRNPRAKMVLIDITPYTTTQVSDNKDVLNIGSFNDSQFLAIDRFVKGERLDFAKVVNEVVL